MTKLINILKQVLSEEKKKSDRCKRIADRKYDKPSAYKSGAIVRCRQGKIWKDIKEEIVENKIICDNCGWSWKKEDGGKDMYICHKCGHDNTPKLNEIKEEYPKITRIYLDLDGVLAGFDEQFKKYNKEGYDFKKYIKEFGANKAWDIINAGKEDFWSEMSWNPGGKQLYDYITKMAAKKGIEVWILSSPGDDPSGDAKRGKNKWVNKHLNIPENNRIYKKASQKHTEAKEGYILIDDMGKNVTEFTQAGGIGIKNNPENSIESIEKLHKYKL